MKHQFVVKARYPEAIVKHVYQDTKVLATNFGQAAKQALTEFQNREGIKRKRLNSVTLSIVRTDSETTADPSEG